MAVSLEQFSRQHPGSSVLSERDPWGAFSTSFPRLKSQSNGRLGGIQGEQLLEFVVAKRLWLGAKSSGEFTSGCSRWQRSLRQLACKDALSECR